MKNVVKNFFRLDDEEFYEEEETTSTQVKSKQQPEAQPPVQEVSKNAMAIPNRPRPNKSKSRQQYQLLLKMSK